MLDFTRIPPQELREFIENGKVDDLLEDILENFWSLSAEVQYALIKRMRLLNEDISIATLSRVFGCKEKEAFEILTNECREVFFPVVNDKGDGRLVRALIIKDTSSLITNSPSRLDELRILGENFSLFFDSLFEGSSYMLAVGVGLRCDEIPEGLAFTGRIDSTGNVYPVGSIKEKRRICEREGFRLVSPYELREKNLNYLVDWLSKDTLDIPFYFTTFQESAESEFKKFLRYTKTDPEALRVFYGIDVRTFLQASGRLEGVRWFESAKEFYRRISTLQSGDKKRHIHLAGRMPSSLAFAFGILFGSQTPFTFYHFQNQEYIPVVVQNVRYLKERTDVGRIEGFIYKYIPKGDELVVLVGGAFHTAGAAVREFMGEGDYSFLLTGHERSGNLSPERMMEFSRAVSSLIQEKKDDREFKRYHFFFSCPVSVAFMLGVSFGHYAPASIYNYEQGEERYIQVLRTEELRRIREGSPGS